MSLDLTDIALVTAVVVIAALFWRSHGCLLYTSDAADE